MTRRKQPQQTLWEGLVAEDVKSLWEAWMVEADKRTGKLKRSVRNRMRSVNKRVIAIAFSRGIKGKRVRKGGRSITVGCCA